MNEYMDTIEKQFKELLEDIYLKGQEAEYIHLEDFLADLKGDLRSIFHLQTISHGDGTS